MPKGELQMVPGDWRNRIGAIAALWLMAGTLQAAEPAMEPSPFVMPKIHVPEGYTVELAAGPPLVEHPMMATFDNRGRLFIAESAGLNLRNNELEEQLPNFVRMLEDTDDDGKFDRSTIFADKMTFPMGGCWRDGSLYVASPPNIWKLTDTDDDGVADKREILVSKFGYNGNAADIHGCFAGPDGRIYWCDGRHGHDIQDAEGHVTSQGKAARIFSCKPDGSDIRVQCGGGMDNPVEIDFLPNGDMVGTVNLLYRQRGDCLVHWMHGGVYPREDQVDCLAEFPRTGELLTPIHDFGHVAVSGMMRYRSTHFGEDYKDNIFVTEFNTHSVKRAILKLQGSSYRADVEEFFRAESDDFHPTDVLEDADGSLLVIDTGGWFRIGCPTSQIAKPNILGAIYRIRRTAAEPIADPRGLKMKWEGEHVEELVARLGDQRPAVRERTIEVLAKMGNAVVPDLMRPESSSASGDAEQGAIWVLTRIGTMEAQEAVREYFDWEFLGISEAAIFSAGQTRDRVAVELLTEKLAAESHSTRRIAATSLGKIGESFAVPKLMEAMDDTNDLLLDHALRFALIEIGAREQTLAGLKYLSPRSQLGALIALDQMNDGNLTREDVLPLLDTSDTPLRAAALEIIGKHPDWASETIVLLRSWLTDEKAERDLNQVCTLILALETDEAVQKLVGELLVSETISPAVEEMLYQVIGGSRIRPMPQVWQIPLEKLFATNQAPRVTLAINTVVAADSEIFDDKLLVASLDRSLAQPVRDTALLQPASHGRPVSDEQFARLLELLGAEEAVVKLSAAEALGSAALTPQQRTSLLAPLSKATPLELPVLAAAFQSRAAAGEQSAKSIGQSNELGLQFVAALEKSPGRRSLSARNLSELLEFYPSDVQAAAAALLKELNPGLQAEAEQIAALTTRMAGGDVARGREVFFSQRAICASCHRIEKEGAQIGPELTGIGKRRNLRDLVEAVVYPSASLARDFESYAIATSGGQVHTGLILRQTSDALILRTTQQKEVMIARSEIDELVPSPISIMPLGLDRVLSEQQLRDLLAYLESLK
jgi:putative membrane-bound dehydrogenase-like protein